MNEIVIHRQECQEVTKIDELDVSRPLALYCGHLYEKDDEGKIVNGNSFAIENIDVFIKELKGHIEKLEIIK